MSSEFHFPFTALQGQPLLQQALLLATVDPFIGGVLLEGPRGTAKSTAARALAELLPGGSFVNLPLSASEEQVVGSLDLEAALQGGEVRFRPGLLARAHEGVLYVDEVNLLADALVDVLLDVCASGVNRIERDGISHAHAARITLVGTMNPEEGELRPQLLDRFGLFVRIDPSIPPAERQAIVRARLAFDADPAAFVARHAADQQALAKRIALARASLPLIDFTEDNHEYVARLCHVAEVEGVRADLVMLRAARARAALAERNTIEKADIDAVAELVLLHRRNAAPEQSASTNQVDRSPDTHKRQPSVGQDSSSTNTSDDEDWGALSPQSVPIAGVKTVRPLHAKKP